VTVIVGLLLGLGLLLAAAPWLWPAPRGRSRADPRWADRLGVWVGSGAFPIRALVAVSVLTALAAAGLLLALTGVAPLAIAGGVLALALPAGVLRTRERRRRRSAREAWPGILDHLVASLRAGIPLPDALASLQTTGPESLRPIFASFARDYRVSGNFGACLDELKDAAADPVADRIAETLRMARDVGGAELTSVLRALAAHLRQQAAVRAELEARQSWVTNAAKLGVAAPWVVLVLLCTRPEAAAAYASGGGVLLVLGGVAVSVVAYRVMLRIGRIPEEGRWFR